MRRIVVSRCTCGRVKNKHSDECNVCHNRHVAAMKSKAKSIVAIGKCPECGTKLVRNNALQGLWQCGRNVPGNAGTTGCPFQCFTE